MTCSVGNTIHHKTSKIEAPALVSGVDIPKCVY